MLLLSGPFERFICHKQYVMVAVSSPSETEMPSLVVRLDSAGRAEVSMVIGVS